MVEIDKQCRVEDCTFPTGKCQFLLRTEERARKFQGAEDPSSVLQNNDAAIRWSRTIHDLYKKLDDSTCIKKDEVGKGMQDIIPESLKLSQKV
ncbi:MAG: hypothetical protein ABIJ05_01695 [Patescibacteria group bacterium]